MSTARNKELVHTYLERVVGGGELALADTLLDPEFVFTSPYTRVKLGCTHAMLTCLGREERLAFVLDEVLGLSGEEGAEVAGVEPAAFRKRVSRARGRMRDFLEVSCGLVSESAACRCRKQVGPALAAGRIDRERLVYAVHPTDAERDPVLWRAYRAIEEADEGAGVFRSHPRYRAPAALERLADVLKLP